MGGRDDESSYTGKMRHRTGGDGADASARQEEYAERAVEDETAQQTVDEAVEEAQEGDIPGHVLPPEGEELDLDELEPGQIVAIRNEDGDLIHGEVEGVTEGPNGETHLQIRTGENSYQELVESDIGAVRQSDYHSRPDISLSWPDDRDARVEEIRNALEDHIPTEIPEQYDDVAADEETRQAVIDAQADMLADAKDPQLAEDVIGSCLYVADGRPECGEIDGEHMDPRFFVRMRGTSEDAIKHEVGHGVLKAYGYGGAGYAVNGNRTDDYPAFGWDDEHVDPVAVGSISHPRGTRNEASDAGKDAHSLGRNEWQSDVDDSFGATYESNDFDRISESDDPREHWAHNDLGEGTLVRFDQPIRENRNLSSSLPSTRPEYKVTEVSEQFPESPVSPKTITLESWEGTEYQARVRGDGTIETADMQATRGSLPEIEGKRDSASDWGLGSADPDAHLGSGEMSDPTEAIETLARESNRAWYKQAAAGREGGQRAVDKTNITGSYSVQSAHETAARTFEVLQGGMGEGNQRNAAESLVNHHPGLLEAYRQVWEIDSGMKKQLNAELENAGAEFRFD